MEPNMFGSGLGIVIFLFLIVLAILWFLLPFAVFGIKDRLDNFVTEAKSTNKHLDNLRAEIDELRDSLEAALAQNKAEIDADESPLSSPQSS